MVWMFRYAFPSARASRRRSEGGDAVRMMACCRVGAPFVMVTPAPSIEHG
jgi:hypothetical protein